MENISIFWIAFNIIILGMIAIDLFVVRKNAHNVGFREALTWSLIWVALSLGFGTFIFLFMGYEKGAEFFSGYIVEKMLSIDNIFIFSVIFHALSIPLKYQHRVLVWGVIGALLLRGLMIWLGLTLINHFHNIIYILGALLIYTSFKMFWVTEKTFELGKHPLFLFFQKYIPLSSKLDGQKFWVRNKKKPRQWQATPLFVALALIEASDLIFAVDSIPAIFAITLDPFIVYTSNIFAILGLRSLYFLLADAIERFYYLKSGVALILCFVGIKMVIADFYKIPTGWSLLVIILILGGSILLSYWSRSQKCHK
jgi:tellurite resistance protein TerC